MLDVYFEAFLALLFPQDKEFQQVVRFLDDYSRIGDTFCLTAQYHVATVKSHVTFHSER